MTTLHAQITLTINGKTMSKDIAFSPIARDCLKLQQRILQQRIEHLLEPFQAIERMQSDDAIRDELREWVTLACHNEPDVAPQDHSPT